MPSNLSENKVRVVKLFGASAGKGMMDPKVNMSTNQGTIVQVKSSGTFLVSVSGQGVGSPRDFYAHQLFVSEDQATGVFSYPTGDGSVVFGRAQEWPSGVPVASVTGMFYATPDGVPFEFQRS